MSVRPATLGDLPFIDSLQKKHKKQLGFMSMGALRGKIELGHVLIAEEGDEATKRRSDEGGSGPPSVPSSLRRSVASSLLLGYIIGNDQYHKHDDVGVIYQLNVVPGRRRSLIGAALVKAMFDRAAYGCRLFCCWCAQDIDANHFWESIGFLPLAFRTGSRGKGRIHIFWQRRIRAGDTTTPWWFPAKTTGGMLGEDRLVLPIPPGTHWSDAKPVILPGSEPKQLPDAPRKPRQKKPAGPKIDRRDIAMGGLRAAPVRPANVAAPAERAAKPRRVRQKVDPTHVAAARELRDRYLEHVNAGAMQLESAGKYDLSRTLTSASSVEPSAVEGSRALPQTRAAAALGAVTPALAAAVRLTISRGGTSVRARRAG